RRQSSRSAGQAGRRESIAPIFLAFTLTRDAGFRRFTEQGKKGNSGICSNCVNNEIAKSSMPPGSEELEHFQTCNAWERRHCQIEVVSRIPQGECAAQEEKDPKMFECVRN